VKGAVRGVVIEQILTAKIAGHTINVTVKLYSSPKRGYSSPRELVEVWLPNSLKGHPHCYDRPGAPVGTVSATARSNRQSLS